MLNQVKKEDAARKYFKRLIKDYPKSKFIPYAFLAFGDYFFDQKQLEDALKFYDKVMQFPESPIYGYAKYKEGWVYYNLGDFKQALATFVERHRAQRRRAAPAAIEDAEARARQGSEEGLGARLRAHRHAGEGVGLLPSHRRRLRDDDDGAARRALQRAGPVPGLDQGLPQPDGARRPSSPKLCFWQGEVMKNTLSATGSRASPDNVKELQRLGAVYEKVKDARASRRSSSRSAATTPPTRSASSRPSGTRKRRRPTTTTPMRSRSISIRNI